MTQDPLLDKLDEILRHWFGPQGAPHHPMGKELRALMADVAIEEHRRAHVARYGVEPEGHVLDVIRSQRLDRFGVGVEESKPYTPSWKPEDGGEEEP